MTHQLTLTVTVDADEPLDVVLELLELAGDDLARALLRAQIGGRQVITAVAIAGPGAVDVDSPASNPDVS